MPYSFSNQLSGSFTCPVCSNDTWDLDLKSHTKDMVRRRIKRITPGLTVCLATPRQRSTGRLSLYYVLCLIFMHIQYSCCFEILYSTAHY